MKKLLALLVVAAFVFAVVTPGFSQTKATPEKSEKKVVAPKASDTAKEKSSVNSKVNRGDSKPVKKPNAEKEKPKTEKTKPAPEKAKAKPKAEKPVEKK